MVSPLEALADAITAEEGWRPGSRSYRNRNPGNLRRSSLALSTDQQGYAIFNTLTTGRIALINDLRVKCAGQSKTHLKPTSTLADLLTVWAPPTDGNLPHQYIRFAVAYITKALGHEVTPDTPLSFFYNGQP